MTSLYRLALSELETATAGIDDKSVDRACTMIARARKIVLYACGREGLQIRGFAMRLFHLGRKIAMVGDMNTPPLSAGDLFIVSAGPGEVSTVLALTEIAKAAGAEIVFLTAQPGGRVAAMADEVLVIPAQTMADDQAAGASSVLPMGSVYEGAMFVLFEVMILKLRGMLDITPEEMRANHTNME